ALQRPGGYVQVARQHSEHALAGVRAGAHSWRVQALPHWAGSRLEWWLQASRGAARGAHAVSVWSLDAEPGQAPYRPGCHAPLVKGTGPAPAGALTFPPG